MTYKKISIVLFILFFQTSVVLAGGGKPFAQIIIFGDSLSDNGNIYRLDFGFIPKSPPYFKGRFSNGEVWADHVERFFCRAAPD